MVLKTSKRASITRNNDNLPHFKVKHNCFKNSIFPSIVTECKKLGLNIRNCKSLTSFKSNILKLANMSFNVFLCDNPKGIQ